MDKSELGIIQELMEFLQDKMQYGEEDLSERLGRPKPEVQVTKIEGEMPMGDDAEMESPDMDPMGGMDEMESPEDKLKHRIMKMRG